MEETNDHEEHQKPFFQRLVIVIISLFLVIILLFTYLTPISKIGGQLVSYEINKNYEIQLRSSKVILGEQNYKTLLNLFNEDPKNEFKACLLGYKEAKNYVVTGIYTPKIIQKSLTSVRSEACNSETIISLHSHPFGECSFSRQDISNYESLVSINPDALLGLMCERTRFTIYPDQ